MARPLRSPVAWVVPGWCLLLAAVVCGPVLVHRGFALLGDMVFVPEQPWKDRWLGLDGSVPRAVPSDAVVSALTQLVPGDLVQKAVLFGLLAAGGWGMARLVRDTGPRARCAAVALFVWNPYVYERLAAGHWALLCGYAALPWVVSGAEAVRDHRPHGWGALVLPVAVAALTSPTGGVLAGMVAVSVVAIAREVREAAKTFAGVVVLNLPWLLPGLLATGNGTADAGGVAAFAARADSDLGTLGSLVTLGGIWKTSIFPADRGLLLLSTLALLLVAGGLFGAVRSVRLGSRTMTALVVVAAVGLTLAWLPTTAAARSAFEWWVVTVPGGGLLRDSQKWVAPVALVAAAGVASLVAWLEDAHGRRSGVPALLTMVALLPLAVLPGLAWGQFGRLQPVEYPQEWGRVADLMEEQVGPGERVVVLPFEIYRRFGWNRSRAVLDPAPRFFVGDMVTNDVLRLGGGQALAGEDPGAARIARAVEKGLPLADVLAQEGVAWVLVEKGTPGAEQSLAQRIGRVAHDGPRLRLLRLEGSAPSQELPVWRPAVLVVDAVVGAWMTGVLGLMLWRRLGETLQLQAGRPGAAADPDESGEEA